MKELVTLDLSHNSLTKVPEDMVKAKNLIVISLSHNKISTMPGAVSYFCVVILNSKLANLNKRLLSDPKKAIRKLFIYFM